MKALASKSHRLQNDTLNFLNEKAKLRAVFASKRVAGEIGAILVMLIFIIKLWFTKLELSFTPLMMVFRFSKIIVRLSRFIAGVVLKAVKFAKYSHLVVKNYSF